MNGVLTSGVVSAIGSATPAPRPNAPPQQPREKRVVVDASRRQLLAAGLLGCACAGCTAPALAAPAAEWGYSCVTGGAGSWAGTCKGGKAQSPVDIPLPPLGTASDPDLQPVRIKYPRYLRGTVTNPGHGTMQVNVAPGAEVLIGEERLELVQWHFHTPAEHALGGRRAAMEAHLVHRSPSSGALAVLAVMLEPGAGWAENACLATALASAAGLAKGASAPLARPVSLAGLLPRPSTMDGRRPYATFGGSLTTPPCSEGVSWYVFLDPLLVDARQILQFERYVGGGATLGANARPLQPLAGRRLRYCL